MISVVQDKSGVQPWLILILIIYFTVRQMSTSTLPGLQQLGCSTILVCVPHCMLQQNPAAGHAFWRQNDKEITKEYCHCLTLYDRLCALLFFVLLKGHKTIAFKWQPLFCWFKTMLRAHVKMTSWLNTHYGAQWSGNLLSGHAHCVAIQWVWPSRQQRLAFICILFNSKVQYYTNFNMFHFGFQ